MEQVLVTGGAGFIGSHISELLIQEGFKVRVVDDLRLGHLNNVPAQAEFIQGDIRDSELMLKVTKGAQKVFHLAAESRNLPSLGTEASKLNVDININGTLNVLISSLENGVKNIIYSASSTMYGRNSAPQHEDMLPDTLTPYAATKYSGELLMRTYSNLYNISTHCLRYFQVFGPRQPSSGPYALVTGIFLKQLAEAMPLTIEGDGKQTRDFVHVFDVAEANLRASFQIGKGEPINVGTGKATSIKELANMISQKQVHIAERKFDLPGTQANVERCRTVLKWTPKLNISRDLLVQ